MSKKLFKLFISIDMCKQDYALKTENLFALD